MNVLRPFDFAQDKLHNDAMKTGAWFKKIIIAIANQFKIPVKFIGVGEKMEDLLIFDKHEFVDSLFNLAE